MVSTMLKDFPDLQVLVARYSVRVLPRHYRMTGHDNFEYLCHAAEKIT